MYEHDYVKPPTKSEIINLVSIFLAMLVLIPLMWWGIEIGYLGHNSPAMLYLRPLYYVSMGVTIWIFYKAKARVDIAYLMLILLAPLTLLTFGIRYIIEKGLAYYNQ